jgi:hypothetical protein
MHRINRNIIDPVHIQAEPVHIPGIYPTYMPIYNLVLPLKTKPMLIYIPNHTIRPDRESSNDHPTTFMHTVHKTPITAHAATRTAVANAWSVYPRGLFSPTR